MNTEQKQKQPVGNARILATAQVNTEPQVVLDLQEHRAPQSGSPGPMEEEYKDATEPQRPQQQAPLETPVDVLDLQQHQSPMQGVQRPAAGSSGRGRPKLNESQLRTEVKRLLQTVRRLQKSLKVARERIRKLRGDDSESSSDDDLCAAREDEDDGHGNGAGGGEEGGGEEGGGGPPLGAGRGGQEGDDEDSEEEEAEDDESNRVGKLLVETVEEVGVFLEPVNGCNQLSRKSAMVLQSMIVDCGVSAEKLPLALSLFLQLYFGNIDEESYAQLVRSTPTIQKAVDRIGHAVTTEAANNFTDRESPHSYEVKP